MSSGAIDLGQRLRSTIGKQTADALEDAFGYTCVGDLLRHYPRRVVRKGELTPLRGLRLGELATISVRVVGAHVRDLQTKREIPVSDVYKVRKRRTLTSITVTDGDDDMQLTFFNMAFLAAKLRPGSQALFSGKVEEAYKRRNAPAGRLPFQMTNPASDLLEGDATEEEIEERTRALRPLYPATAKLTTWKIELALKLFVDDTEGLAALADVDPIPVAARDRLGIPDLGEAFRRIHRPETEEEFRTGLHRFVVEEALVTQLVLARRRALNADFAARAVERRDDGVLAAFADRLPFELTAGQREVGEEIFTDLARPHPMHRLLQGEVGSGKTVVALRAMLAAVDAGAQAALLAPTEVLATQHHRSLSAMLGPLGAAGELTAADRSTGVVLLTGSMSAAARRPVLAAISDGSAGVVVGTHALLEDKVAFGRLGLVVVDEQHRFGVEQRAALTDKAIDADGTHPHVLVMTATPIPRTVAMTVFGDLVTSTLTELPVGRQPISTTVVPVADKPAWLDRAWDRVREEVAAGHQAYVVCPRIGESAAPEDADQPADDAFLSLVPDLPEDVDKEPPTTSSVLETTDALREGPLHGLTVEMLHGRMAPADKDAVMTRFAAGEVDVLVATTVIEVGVDVPNATMMVILDADRFGVSQLHQLRGRVGRGQDPGLCLLVTGYPDQHPSRERLDAVAGTTDGFRLSEIDLEHRREGDVLGAAQSGRRSSLRLLNVLKHADEITAARREAEILVGEDPELFRSKPLRKMVDDLEHSEQADYLDRT